MGFRTGWFPYVLAAVWAAMVIASLVDMAAFNGAVRGAKRPPSVTAPARAPQARTPARM
ncbi:MAG: hypothetical protein ACJ783_13290 [Myxococcales bacterium]|nr:hypothetical protein [Myxococcales bacterium]